MKNQFASSRIGWRIRRQALKLAFFGRDIDYSNFFKNENVAVFPELGLILNRIKKSGNTSLVAFFDELERQRAGTETSASNAEEAKHCRQLRRQSFSVIAQMPHFATVVSVRNPYHRAISGFLEKIASGTNPRYQKYPDFGNDSIEAFEIFLMQCQENQFLGNRHFYPQTQLLFQPLKHYTKIVRIENLVDDMKPFLVKLGYTTDAAASLAMPHRLEQQHVGKIQKSTEKENLLSCHAIDLINRLYERDFRILGYNRMNES